jgi:hypothetical protein
MQAPEAGRNKYLGNIFQDVSQFVFRHADEKARPEVNAADAGKQKDLFDLSPSRTHATCSTASGGRLACSSRPASSTLR